MSVRNLCVDTESGGPILRDVSLEVAAGEVVVVTGESGSGKTTLARALLGLLPAQIAVSSGHVAFRGQDLAGLSEPALRRLRGAALALVPQEPGLALNPVLRVGHQIAEVLTAHDACPPERRREAAVALLAQVGLPEPRDLHDAYPHELSGGQRQRVAIAQAVACRPALVVADEPTTALDPINRAQIMALLGQLRRQLGLALLIISHDLEAVAPLADRMLVMYAGRIVEAGPLRTVMQEPRHPYTRGLLASLPKPRTPRPDRLPSIPGSPPDMGALPPGCAFAPRCDARRDVCSQRLPGPTFDGERRVHCFEYGG